LLKVNQLDVFYGDVQALRGVSLEVGEREVVALIGANGAGKTTTLKTISGLLKPLTGEVVFDGKPIGRAPPHEIVSAGLVHVPEGRKVFPRMTVLENLELGALVPHAKARRRQTLEMVLEMFPRLQERRSQLAGTMSGGEQQMLALGRALMALPRLLMLDEPSLGLAPLIVEQILRAVEAVNREQGLPILIVEQNVSHALRMSSRGYVIENGEIMLEGPGHELLANPEMKKAYLGM
jgi:branched-chain amino acid transport system ATP-binding protein